MRPQQADRPCPGVTQAGVTPSHPDLHQGPRSHWRTRERCQKRALSPGEGSLDRGSCHLQGPRPAGTEPHQGDDRPCQSGETASRSQGGEHRADALGWPALDALHTPAPRPGLGTTRQLGVSPGGKQPRLWSAGGSPGAAPAMRRRGGGHLHTAVGEGQAVSVAGQALLLAVIGAGGRGESIARVDVVGVDGLPPRSTPANKEAC